MLDKIEMSLDDIIKQTKQPRGGGKGRQSGRRPGVARGGQKGGNLRKGGLGGVRRQNNRQNSGRVQKRSVGGGAKFSRGDVNKTWTHDLFEGRGGGRANQGATKLLISNLDFGVSESDVQELFSEFGPLKGSSVHYDRSGRSLGTADIIYERRADALKAMKTYNGVPLDGRPMQIQLATSEVPTQRPVVVQQRRTGGNINRGRQGGGLGNRKGGPRQGGGGGGRRPQQVRKPQVTAEELDAELDAYTKDMKI